MLSLIPLLSLKVCTALIRPIVPMEILSLIHICSLSDTLKDKLGSGILVIGTVMEDKVSLIVTVSKELAGKRAHAGNLIKEIAKVCGGGGGGRPDMAQAGAKDPGKLDEALAKAKEIIAQSLA